MSNDNENKRKTLKLGKINNDIQKNIESFTKGNKVFDKKDNSKKEISLDNKNATEFLKAVKDRTSFGNMDLIRQRQDHKSFKNLDLKHNINKTNVSDNLSSQNEAEKSTIDNNKNQEKIVNNIDAHKILSSYAQKQKEEERAKREAERAKREAEQKKKQEEELKKFNAKANKNKIDNNEEKSYEDKKVDNNKFSNVNNENSSKTSFKKDNHKKYNKNYDDDDEEENNNSKNKQNSKKSIQATHYSKNKNIHTYILNDDDDDDNGFGRRRKSNKSFFKNKEKTEEVVHQKIIQDIELPEFITVADLAEKMNEKKADVVKKLISMGMPCTVNQTIDADTAELVVVEFGHNVVKRTTEHDIEDKLGEEQGSKFVSRAPVVTIMGHVDHGKTSLLDAIRTTHVAEGESGGITQHIGASRVEVENGKFITFIDTPGHEAFTEMRMRGASITDIVVLVVAADDGVKDQTVEAINHSKAAGVPIILAINKIDKPGADPMRVKQELLQYDIVTEDFGGEVMAVEVSAKQKIGLEKLREAILLQAEIMELKAPIDVKPAGAIIEAKMDQKRGPIASLLVQKGILKVGDLVLAGTSYGKIRKMIDDKHKPQKEASPSMAVEILGFDSVPTAGDQFYVLDEEKEVRDIIAYRERKALENKVAKRPVIIKADVNGSIEAIIGTLTKLNTPEVEIDVVHSATGAINETDVNLASVSNALILGFNVRANSNAVDLAKEKYIDIRYYSIIYNIVDDIKNILSGMLEPVKKEEIMGHAEVRQVFKITGVGKVAGCFVLDGEISRNDKVRLIRDGIVIYSGDLKALKRFKDDVKEVKSDYECGISIDNYDDIKEKDIIEGFKITEEKRSL